MACSGPDREAYGAPGPSSPKALLLVRFWQMFQVIDVLTSRLMMFIFCENKMNLNIPHQRVWAMFPTKEEVSDK